MKKLFLLAFTAICFTVNAQDAQFGVTAGYANISEKVSVNEGSVSASESGFYVGAIADISISDQFHIQPEALYASAAETSFLYIPVLGKYYITEQFNLQAGPQATLLLDETIEGYNSFGLDAAFGAGFDINENFFVEARYAFEVTNRLQDGGDFDVTDRINTLHVGVGYKF